MVTWHPTPSPCLVLKTDSGNHIFPLTGSNCWTIGRSEDNNLVLRDRWISRCHAMLQCMQNGEFYLIDLGSRNGSFVNGRRVSIPVILHHGDRLTFGQTELTFYCPSHHLAKEKHEDDDDFTVTEALRVRSLISVMVVDIRNFTVLTRQLDEKLLSELMGNWFRQSGDIIREHGSWVDKYIGDAIMAVWFHNKQKVSISEIIDILQALNHLYQLTEELNARYPLPFRMRIGAGVNTGYAMVGDTGSRERPDYTALGDTVNAAFRLESCTKEISADIALGETTYQPLASLALSQKLFKQYTVHLKGYDMPTITYASTFVNLKAFLRALSHT